MKIIFTIFIVIAFIFILSGWMQTDPKPKTHPLKFVVPAGWPQPVYDFKNNPPTQEGFELGRKLFYDGRLSKDGNFPCASCHQQFAAFANYDHSLSHGFNNSFTNRNAPPLFNLAWQKKLMWDGGINHLDVQPLKPITDSNEMAETIAGVLQKLRSDADYKKMFAAAFGDTAITTQRFTKALSQFIVMMVSAGSKYDNVMSGKDSFNLPQRLGYEIFQRKCVSCHTEPMFTDYTYRNIGMPADNYLKDAGRMNVTRLAADSLKFRVPTLRNVQVTAPYGHDGRFTYLLNLFDHFRSGVAQSATTDSLLLHGIPLIDFEIGQLKAFLYTLTDTAFLHDKRFAPPGFEDRMPQPPGQHLHQQ